MSFEDESTRELPETWLPNMLGLIQEHCLHWMGRTFHHLASPRILVDLDSYEPTPFLGLPLKAAFAGERFECKKAALTEGRIQGRTRTGVPTATAWRTVSAFQLASRKQPLDSVRPTFSGSGVPWMP